MSQVCNCTDPTVTKPEKGDPYCSKCGHWWMPHLGSLMPASNNVYSGAPRSKVIKRITNFRHRPDPPKIGRNELCPCKSGKKYKKCHGLPHARQIPKPFVPEPTQTDNP